MPVDPVRIDAMRPTEAEFSRRAKTPQYWFNKSSDLRSAAGALWYCMDRSRNLQVARELELGDGFSMAVATRPAYLMLCGLSLELIYKAILVAKGKVPPNQHDLLQLALDAGIATTLEQRQLLSLLTEQIYWAGKYPIPVPRKHESIDDLATLSRKVFYEQHLIGTSPILHQKGNDPLGWQEFRLIWSTGSTVFWKLVNAPTESA